jgi:hypothetical protein
MRLKSFIGELQKIALNQRLLAAGKGLAGGALFGGIQGTVTSAVNPLMIMDASKNGKDDYLKNILYGGLGGAVVGGAVGGTNGAKNLGRRLERTRVQLIGHNAKNGDPALIDPNGTPLFKDHSIEDHLMNARKGGHEARFLAPAIGMGAVMKNRVKKEEQQQKPI